MPLSVPLVVPATLTLVPAMPSEPARAASPPEGSTPPVEASPAKPPVPAKALMAPALATGEPPWPPEPAFVLPPLSTITGGSWLRPPPPTGGARSMSPHAQATQAASTSDGAWRWNGGVTWGD